MVLANSTLLRTARENFILEKERRGETWIRDYSGTVERLGAWTLERWSSDKHRAGALKFIDSPAKDHMLCIREHCYLAGSNIGYPLSQA